VKHTAVNDLLEEFKVKRKLAELVVFAIRFGLRKINLQILTR
jgi:hypothetical protein